MFLREWRIYLFALNPHYVNRLLVSLHSFARPANSPPSSYSPVIVWLSLYGSPLAFHGGMSAAESQHRQIQRVIFGNWFASISQGYKHLPADGYQINYFPKLTLCFFLWSTHWLWTDDGPPKHASARGGRGRRRTSSISSRLLEMNSAHLMSPSLSSSVCKYRGQDEFWAAIYHVHRLAILSSSPN